MQIITGTTQLLGVIGDPVQHSRSPLMHNAAIAQLGVDFVYLPLPVKANDLATALLGFVAIGLRGFNITIPHKQAILPFLQEISPVAAAIGAVNTVWRTADGWAGTNTDAVGFIAPLRELERDWSTVPVLILGCGGAARAVVAGCAELGCPKIAVAGRDPAKLAAFAASWQDSPWSPTLQIIPWSDLATVLPATQLLVNATPLGMAPQVEQSPLTVTALQKLPTSAIAYDLIYTPRPTQFLKLAQQQGFVTIDGSEMLVQQGAAALQIWLDQAVPVAVMRAALLTGT
ncbi:MAG: shikimate dehydrogenase [Spirulinaceae cyanobacterium SM2_1_0]|nr:shikimate dehydrogenase [Spirulinaceae cyanobacterium SM2_1_0]